MQRLKVSDTEGYEEDIIRMEEGISMRMIINRFFDNLKLSMKSRDKSQNTSEASGTSLPGKEIHYKWWGDDRYEPI